MCQLSTLYTPVAPENPHRKESRHQNQPIEKIRGYTWATQGDLYGIQIWLLEQYPI